MEEAAEGGRAASSDSRDTTLSEQRLLECSECLLVSAQSRALVSPMFGRYRHVLRRVCLFFRNNENFGLNRLIHFPEYVAWIPAAVEPSSTSFLPCSYFLQRMF